jgi:hypothetical protein
MDIITDIEGEIAMKTKHVLPQTERKALWVDRETYELVRDFADQNHITMVSATNILLGKVFVEMEGGDFEQSQILQNLVREKGKDKF